MFTYLESKKKPDLSKGLTKSANILNKKNNYHYEPSFIRQSSIQRMSVAAVTEGADGRRTYSYERLKKEGWMILKNIGKEMEDPETTLSDLTFEASDQEKIKILLGDDWQTKKVKNLLAVGLYQKSDAESDGSFSDKHKMDGLNKIAVEAESLITERGGLVGPHIALVVQGDTMYISINSHMPFKNSMESRRADTAKVNAAGEYIDAAGTSVGCYLIPKKVNVKVKKNGVETEKEEDRFDITYADKTTYYKQNKKLDKGAWPYPILSAAPAGDSEVETVTKLKTNSLLEWAVKKAVADLAVKDLSHMSADEQKIYMWIRNKKSKIADTNYKVIALTTNLAEQSKAILHGEMIIAEHLLEKSKKAGTAERAKIGNLDANKYRVIRFGGSKPDCLDCNAHFHGGETAKEAIGNPFIEPSGIHSAESTGSTASPVSTTDLGKSYTELYQQEAKLKSVVRSDKGDLAFNKTFNIVHRDTPDVTYAVREQEERTLKKGLAAADLEIVLLNPTATAASVKVGGVDLDPIHYNNTSTGKCTFNQAYLNSLDIGKYKFDCNQSDGGIRKFQITVNA